MSSVSSPSGGAAAAAAAPATAPAVPAFAYYPAHCFHLSPTLNKWCPLRAADVAGLTQFAEFSSQRIFFHLNHPIRFVRVAGVVVGNTELSKRPDRYTRHVYVLDDGSGATVECFTADTQAAEAVRRRAAPSAADTPAGTSSETFTPAHIPTGTVLDVQGELQRFRGGLQITITKVTPLRSTAQETHVWARMHAFARDTLAHPWVLDRAVQRACRRAARQAQQQGALAAARMGVEVEVFPVKGRPDGREDAVHRSPKKTPLSPPPASYDRAVASTRPRRPAPKKWKIKPEDEDE